MSKEYEQNILAQIKENSGIKNSLSEASSSGDIATTLDFVSTLIDEKYNDSLMYQLCEIQPIEGTFGSIYASKRNETTGNFEIVKKEVHITTDKMRTGFSVEVWQDMLRMFKRNAKKSGANILAKVSTDKENVKIINFLNDESEIKPSLTLTDPESFEAVLHQLGKKVAESVIEMNNKSYNTLDSFCVLPAKWAAAALGSFEFMTEGREESLFVGRIGRCDFYINPIPNTSSQFADDYDLDFEIASSANPNYAFVGLKTKKVGQSSLVFSPYQYETQSITDPDTLEENLILYNRYALNSNPLHDKLEGKGMLHKFEILEV